MCALGASAPTPLRGALSDNRYLALGLVAFLVAAAVQYGLYHYILREPLRARDLEKAKPAYMRWIVTDVVWQGLVIVGSGVYVLTVGSHHPAGFAWVTPAVGAMFGTALPLQIVVIATMRWGRGG